MEMYEPAAILVDPTAASATPEMDGGGSTCEQLLPDPSTPNWNDMPPARAVIVGLVVSEDPMVTSAYAMPYASVLQVVALPVLAGVQAGSPLALASVRLPRGETENCTGDAVTGTPLASMSLIPTGPTSCPARPSKQA